MVKKCSYKKWKLSENTKCHKNKREQHYEIHTRTIHILNMMNIYSKYELTIRVSRFSNSLALATSEFHIHGLQLLREPLSVDSRLYVSSHPLNNIPNPHYDPLPISATVSAKHPYTHAVLFNMCTQFLTLWTNSIFLLI